MSRAILSLTLVFATLAGPCFCCCADTRMPTAHPPARPALPSCCHHPKPENAPPADESSSPRPTHSDPASCPCRGARTGTTPLAVAGPQDPDQAGLRFLTQELAFPGPTLLAPPDLDTTPLLTDHDGPSDPFVTTAQLLRAMHLLRC
jgi:hypothetical protein